MKKILFLTDYWFPQMTANAICIQNVSDVLIKEGNEVFVCAYSDRDSSKNKQELNGIRFYYIKPTIARRLLQEAKHCGKSMKAKILRKTGLAINRLRRFLLIPFYPIVSFSLPCRWANMVNNLVRNEDIDTIVSVVAPDESLYTGYLVKKKNPKVNWIVYYIDSGTNILKKSSFERLKTALSGKAIKWENNVLLQASKVIVMEGHSEYYRSSLSRKNLEKLYVGNVPLLKLSNIFHNFNTVPRNEIEKWVYAGNLSGQYYNPQELCDLFLSYRKNHLAELHLYGPSDHSDYLDKVSDSNNGIYWHGPVSHEFIPAILSTADILVYFVCTKLDSVSGKFFEYLGYGKRIIYYGADNDLNSNHVKKYKRGLSLDMKDSHEKNIDKIETFMLNAPNNGETDEASLRNDYKLSLPETTAKYILE